MDLINLAKEIGAAVQQSEEYINYKIAEQNVECDKELQKIIEKFNLKKAHINTELSKENVNKEKTNALNAEIGELYEKITQNKTMQAYNLAKSAFEETLSKVSLIINSAAQGLDPYTVDTETSDSCSGSCSGCSGCM